MREAGVFLNFNENEMLNCSDSMTKRASYSFVFLLYLSTFVWSEDARMVDIDLYKKGVFPYQDLTEAYLQKSTSVDVSLNVEYQIDEEDEEKPPKEEPPEVFGPSTLRKAYKVRYPTYEKSLLNFMAPSPVPNNIQIYPFVMHIPMEGADLLKVKEMELSISQTYAKGELSGKNQFYEVSMDQWYFEQNFNYKIGLPYQSQLSVQIPLYHFNGDTKFLQSGVELIGLGEKTRNFWASPILNFKKLYFENHDDGTKGLLSAWFQFPEGNQRARGGTSSGHWALNSIWEIMRRTYRYQFNLGLLKGGDLRLLNDAVLEQGFGYFFSIALTKKLSPTSAFETQVHMYRSTLSSTNLSDFSKLRPYGSMGYRKHYQGWDFSSSLILGPDEVPKTGLQLDVRYRW